MIQYLSSVVSLHGEASKPSDAERRRVSVSLMLRSLLRFFCPCGRGFHDQSPKPKRSLLSESEDI